jgi:hypothetical protein
MIDFEKMFDLAKREGLLEIWEQYQNEGDDAFKECLAVVATDVDEEHVSNVLRKYPEYAQQFWAIYRYCDKRMTYKEVLDFRN